ncbi:MAG: hypothetical protein M3Y35_14170 [Actinomycetota bacterium]|nr:hypothetical protein [Actinomycetota bacterium]
MLFRTRTLVLVAAALAAMMMLGACTTGHTRADRPSTSSATDSTGVSASNGSSTTGTSSATGSTGVSASNGSSATSRPPDYRAELTARPLHLPVDGRGQSCPVSGGTPIDAGGFRGVAQGPGPVHPIGADTHGDAPLFRGTQSPGWLAFKSLWFSEPGYQGPFLVRIQRIDGGGPAGMLDDPQVSSFYVPAGPTVNGTDGYREQPGATWVKTPGCLAWQVDGLTFSHVIVVRALCRPPYCLMPSPASTATSSARAAEETHLRRFIAAYNAGDLRAALDQFASTATIGFSDCDYANGQPVDGHGRAQVTAWLRRNIAQHDHLDIGVVSNSNADQPVGVLGVTFSRRSSDTIVRAGHRNGIAPSTGAKVKFARNDLITEFNNGPSGGPPDACRVS